VISWQYIAGFFDGEGTVVITVRGQVRCVTVQSTREVLDLIQVFLGYGTVRKNRPRFYRLGIYAREDVRDFIEGILPFTVVKRTQLEEALRLLDCTGRERRAGAVTLKELRRALKD
jgi:intein-encoded DNA endonuclease-like protein